MELHCIRHGLTKANQELRFNGCSDDPLTEPQRRALGEITFAVDGYDAIFCSPLRRATETAEGLGIDRYRLEPRIAERNLGVFQGLTSQECIERYPSEFSEFQSFSADFAMPGGESRAQNLERVLGWLEEVSSLEQVLAITHGGTIDFLYRLAADLPIHGGERIFSARNTSLSEFEIRWPDVQLIAFDTPLE